MTPHSTTTSNSDSMGGLSRLVLLLLVITALWLAMIRVATLGRDSLQFDEIQMLEVAALPTAAAFDAAIPADAPPLGYHVLRFWGVENRGDAALRVPSVVCGLLAIIPLIGFLFYAWPDGWRRRAVPCIIAGVILFLIHPLFWRLTGRLTPESLALALLAWSAFFGLMWLKSGRWAWSAAMTVGAILSLTAMNAALYSIAALIIALAAAVLIHRPDFGILRGLKGLAPPMLGSFLIVAWAWQRGGTFALFSSDSIHDHGLPGWIMRHVLGLIGPDQPILLAALSFVTLIWGGAALIIAVRFKVAGVIVAVIWLLIGLVMMLVLNWAVVSIPPAGQMGLFLMPLALLHAFGLMSAGSLAGGANLGRARRWGIVGAAILAPAALTLWAHGRAIPTAFEQTPPFRSAVRALAIAPPGSLALLPGNQAKSVYEFYKDERFPGAPEARVFDPGSPYQAELMLALERVYVVDVGGDPGGADDEAAQELARLVQARGGRIEAWLPPLTVLKSYKVSPDIGPLPEDGVVPLGSGDGGGPFHVVRGFYKPEMWGDTEVRWAHPHARVAVVLSPEQAGHYQTIRLRAFAWSDEKDSPRTVELSINGASMGRRVMPPRGPHTVEWSIPDLRPGLALLAITTPDAIPQPPGDPRQLSLAVYEISFQE